MPAIPPHACDCHMHVFGDPGVYPPAPGAAYTPVPAGLADYRALADSLGLERTVFVQPSAYGTDNRVVLEALAASGIERARAVAVIDDGADAATLEALHAAGVRGVRLNMLSAGRDQADDLRESLGLTARMVAPLGWHVQVFASLAVIVAVEDAIRGCPTPVVVDHMGSAVAADGVEQAGLDVLLSLLGSGDVWVKLSGAYRVSEREPDFADAAPIMRALIAANPEQLVWGTDWPHLGPHAGPHEGAPPAAVYRDIDNAGLLDLLAEAAGDASTLSAILADNPARLYGFHTA